MPPDVTCVASAPIQHTPIAVLRTQTHKHHARPNACSLRLTLTFPFLIKSFSDYASWEKVKWDEEEMAKIGKDSRRVTQGDTTPRITPLFAHHHVMNSQEFTAKSGVFHFSQS